MPHSSGASCLAFGLPGHDPARALQPLPQVLLSHGAPLLLLLLR
jgi:hypothetical protein